MAEEWCGSGAVDTEHTSGRPLPTIKWNLSKIRNHSGQKEKGEITVTNASLTHHIHLLCSCPGDISLSFPIRKQYGRSWKYVWVCVYQLFSSQLSNFCFLGHQGYLFLTYQKMQKFPTLCSHFTILKWFSLPYRDEVIYTSGHSRYKKKICSLNISLHINIWWNVLQATRNINFKLSQPGNLHQSMPCWGQHCWIFNVPLKNINKLYFEILQTDFKCIWKHFFTMVKSSSELQLNSFLKFGFPVGINISEDIIFY